MCTSRNTSMNSSRPPRLVNLIDWPATIQETGFCCGCVVVDYGAGRYSDTTEAAIRSLAGEWEDCLEYLPYDPYNIAPADNLPALEALREGMQSVILCSNVLNVLDSDEALRDLIDTITPAPGDPLPAVFVSVYEGDRTGRGRYTRPDCYQRNTRTRDYMKYFPDDFVLRKGVITNCPELLK